MADYSVIARWLLDEASSGTAPTTIADDTGNGNDLTINYSSGDAAWTSVAAGNGLDFTASPGTSDTAIAVLSDIVNNGNLGASLDGVDELSITAVLDIDAGSSLGSRIFAIGTSSGDGDLALVHSDLSLFVRYNDETLFGGQAEFANLQGDGLTVIHVVIDTKQATSANRIRVWQDGSELTQVSQGGGYPAQNDGLDNINNTNRSVSIGNRPSQNRNIDGRVYYLELGTGTLTSTQISDSVTALTADNDSDPYADPTQTIAVGIATETESAPSVSVIVQDGIVDTATENSSALPITVARVIPIGIASDTSTANFISPGILGVDFNTALGFPSNNTPNSDIRLVWDGANLLDRQDHTAIIKVRYNQQTGYYATMWHSFNTGQWDNGYWTYGTHPYPCNGNYSSSGPTTDPIWHLDGGDANDGTEHWYEIAADGLDLISKPSSLGSQEALETTKDVWVTHLRICETINSGADLRETFYPDREGNPSFYIVYERDVAGMTTGPLGTPSDPAFYIGASDWRANTPSSGQNDECTSGDVRFIKLFDAALSLSDADEEIAEESNTPVSAGGIANTWYMNINPSVNDTEDKSGEGHNPSWANANRPSTTIIPLQIVSQASTTESALPVSITKNVAVGIASESSSGMSASPVKAVNVGLSNESTSSIGINAVKQVLVDIVAESSSSRSIVPTGPSYQNVAVGLAQETQNSLGIIPARGIDASFSTENEIALSISISKVVDVGIASETSNSLSSTVAHPVSVGVAQETSSSLSVSYDRQVGLGVSSDTENSLAISPIKRVVLGIATEAESSLSIGNAVGVEIGIASDSESPFSIGITKVVSLGLAIENSSSLQISNPYNTTVEQASTTESSLGIAPLKRISINQAENTESPLGITITKIVPVGLATETQESLSLTPLNYTLVTLGIASESQSCFPVSITKTVGVGIASELSSSLSLDITAYSAIIKSIRAINAEDVALLTTTS